jgi:hypothetical protein
VVGLLVLANTLNIAAEFREVSNGYCGTPDGYDPRGARDSASSS